MHSPRPAADSSLPSASTTTARSSAASGKSHLHSGRHCWRPCSSTATSRLTSIVPSRILTDASLRADSRYPRRSPRPLRRQRRSRSSASPPGPLKLPPFPARHDLRHRGGGLQARESTRAPCGSSSAAHPRSRPRGWRGTRAARPQPGTHRRCRTAWTARAPASRPDTVHSSATSLRSSPSGSNRSFSTSIGPSVTRSSSSMPSTWAAKNARCSFENSLRNGRSPSVPDAPHRRPAPA